jgi:hypothetical protein
MNMAACAEWALARGIMREVSLMHPGSCFSAAAHGRVTRNAYPLAQCAMATSKVGCRQQARAAGCMPGSCCVPALMGWGGVGGFSYVLERHAA